MTGRRSDLGESYQAWYRSRRWAKVRKQQLARQPYCQCPHHVGNRVPADVVDHDIPHKGNAALFWNVGNLISLSKLCHDRYKQSAERGGYGFAQGSDEHGLPLVAQPGWSKGGSSASNSH